jgi:hypothetical protein
MLDATTCVPATIDVRVVLLILIVKVLALRLRTVHAVKADTVEVALGVRLGLEHDRLPIHAAAARAFRHVCVLESTEAVDDVLNRVVADDVFDRKHFALGESMKVATEDCVPAVAGLCAVAEEVAALLAKTIIESHLEATTGVVDKTWRALVASRHRTCRRLCTDEIAWRKI